MRPEGFKNPYKNRGFSEVYTESMMSLNRDELKRQIPESARNCFEAGADAYEKGLRKEGTEIKEGVAYCSPCEVCNNGEDCIAAEDGVLVFIPEEKE